MAAKPVLEADKLLLRLGGKTIVKGVDLQLFPGDFVALLGPNGAGKSTLLKGLALLLRPAGGTVRIKGEDGREGMARRALGFISHGSFLYDRLSAWENLYFYGGLYDVPELDSRIKKLMDRVGLYPFLHEPVATFSRGMLQRLSIARALLPEPDILLLDEPYTGLDQKGSEMLAGMLRDYHSRGKTVLMTTHVFDQAAVDWNRILILKGGRMALDETYSPAGGRTPAEIYRHQVEEV